MEVKQLLTLNGLRLPCVVFPIIQGKMVIAYFQNRIVKGYVEGDSIVEFEVIVEFAIIPELEELIKENKSCSE